jgi:hypothetical protein
MRERERILNETIRDNIVEFPRQQQLAAAIRAVICLVLKEPVSRDTRHARFYLAQAGRFISTRIAVPETAAVVSSGHA